MDERAFVLIVEAEEAQAETVADGLQRAGHACRVVSGGQEAIDSIKQRPPDVVLTGYRLGDDLTGLDVLRAAKEIAPDTEVILITAHGSEQIARDALSRDSQYRAYDYVIQPVDIEQIREKVQRAARQAITSRDKRQLEEQVEHAFSFEGILGNSPVLAKAVKRVRKLAASKAVILIIGETGTGKELVAHAIHNNSPRRGRPFKIINCAALSETLLESELFGHVKGSFTGALGDRKGLLEAADGGTLFLDEIGDMPPRMQAKLLRTLETGEVLPVGSNEPRFVDVRFVAATHRDLWDMVKEGKFREDLLYRLHAQGAIRLPPLRERREDIPLLVQYFLKKANQENGTEVEGAAPEVMRKLTQYSWPGNVRELRNVVELMVLEAERPILEMADLPDPVRGSTEIVPVGIPGLAGLSMADVEKLHILNTLKLTGGNREKAAKMLRIGARTLYRKLKEYDIN
ncbi:MAG: sigma-54-dependent Fis family transcriptional regulator [Phycisphaerae bacterium]|nr:sigma-54-dependent Fis family transcriptional regulator [Phycisphaerae bacterium]